MAKSIVLCYNTITKIYAQSHNDSWYRHE